MDGMDLKEKLKKKGCKLTMQRRSVLEVLEEYDDEHLSTEEIYDKVKEKFPEIGLATVYRTVQLFEEMGIVDRLNLDDGCNRFEIAKEGAIHHHHHLICQKCNKVFEVEQDLLEEIEKEIEKKYYFKIHDHSVAFYGTCQKCAQKVGEEYRKT